MTSIIDDILINVRTQDYNSVRSNLVDNTQCMMSVVTSRFVLYEVELASSLGQESHITNDQIYIIDKLIFDSYAHMIIFF